MRPTVIALAFCLLAAASVHAQVPHPHEDLVHHPLTIESELQAIRGVNPPFIQMSSFGQSVGGFELWMLDFVHPEVREDPARLKATPVYYLDANHHGNEQLGMESLLIFMEELAQWSLTEEGQERLGHVRVVAAPMINPDGTGTDKRVNTRGVDLNRNYDYNWGLYGTSDMMNPVTGNYRGDSPLSEPETSANAALIDELRPDIYLSMHTGSHDIVLPWRQEPDADGPMPDWPVYEHWLAQIENVSGLGYRDPSGAGESISYAYGMHGALSLVVEVDELQTEVRVEDMAQRLVEEVAIFWDTLHRLETLGGWLVVENGTLVNRGIGPAYNVTLHAADAGGANAGDARVLLAAVLASGASLEPGPGTVTYERRAQGDAGVPTWSVAAPTSADDVPEPAASPLPILGLMAALAAVALRRRPA